MEWYDFTKRFYFDPKLFLVYSQDLVANKYHWLPLEQLSDFPADLEQDFFFSPAMFKSKGTEKKDVHGTKYLWVDVDKPKLPLYSCFLPTYTVKSGKGLHLYWELDKPLLDIEKIEELNKILSSSITGADRSTFNCNRVLRVPLSVNTKYLEKPRVVVSNINPVTYTVEEIQHLARIPDKIRHKIASGDSRGYKSRSELDFKVVSALVEAEVPEQLIKKLFMLQPIGAKMREHSNPDHYLKHTLENASVSTQEKEKLVASKKGLVEQGNSYYFAGSRGTTKVSTFVIKPKFLLQAQDQDYLIGDIATESGDYLTDVILPKRAFNTTNKFQEIITSASVVWLGSDQVFKYLLPYLVEEIDIDNKIPATTILGLEEEKYFVLGEHVLSEDQVYQGFESPVIYIDKDHRRPEMRKPCFDPFDKTHILNFANINIREKMLCMLGWYAATPIKEYLFVRGQRFPVLNVSGTQGSGKTTTLSKLSELFGQYSKFYNADTTKFVMLTMLGTTNAFPINLSEFRLTDAPYLIRWILLSYDEGRDARGRSDLTTVEFPLKAPFTIDGEDVVTDPACRERIVTVNLHKADTPKHKVSFDKLYIPEGFFSSYLVYLLKNIDKTLPILNKAKKEIVELFGNLPDRVVHNHAIVHLGTHFLFSFLGEPVPDVRYLEASMSRIVDLASGRSAILLDEFVVDICNYVNAKTARFDFTIDEDRNLLINMVSAHGQWAKDRRFQGKTTLDARAMIEQIEDAPYMDTVVLKGIRWYRIIMKEASKHLNAYLRTIIVPVEINMEDK